MCILEPQKCFRDTLYYVRSYLTLLVNQTLCLTLQACKAHTGHEHVNDKCSNHFPLFLATSFTYLFGTPMYFGRGWVD